VLPTIDINELVIRSEREEGNDFSELLSVLVKLDIFAHHVLLVLTTEEESALFGENESEEFAHSDPSVLGGAALGPWDDTEFFHAFTPARCSVADTHHLTISSNEHGVIVSSVGLDGANLLDASEGLVVFEMNIFSVANTQSASHLDFVDSDREFDSDFLACGDLELVRLAFAEGTCVKND